MNINKLLTSRYPIQTWWEYLNIGALGIGSSFFASLLFIYNWNDNPVLWRVFSPKSISLGPGDHHALIMLIFGVMFYLTVYFKVNPLLTFIGIYFYVQAYEGMWYLTYVPAKLFYGGQFEWQWLTITVLSLPAIIFYIKMFGIPWKFLAFNIPMFALWFIIGFPITNDFPGRTSIFFNINVNIFEICTHIYAGVGFFLFIFPTLKGKSDKISMKWHRFTKDSKVYK